MRLQAVWTVKKKVPMIWRQRDSTALGWVALVLRVFDNTALG
jgi:hypothetical protein